ncbi:hypothetical protein GCM10009771_22710 [Nesterenkonia flava]
MAEPQGGAHHRGADDHGEHGPGIDSEQPGIGKRVAGQGLHQCARHPEAGAYQDRQKSARNAPIKNQQFICVTFAYRRCFASDKLSEDFHYGGSFNAPRADKEADHAERAEKRCAEQNDEHSASA